MSGLELHTTGMAQYYMHSHLDYSARQFRLFQLYADPFDAAIRGTLFEADLDDDAILYEAVSYSWGGYDLKASIEVDGRAYPVTQNLYEALRHIRRTDTDRILWLDAICINQENIKERGHQVGNMKSIFQHAESVIFWLGVAEDNSDLVMDQIRRRASINVDASGVHPTQSDILPQTSAWALAMGDAQNSLQRDMLYEGVRKLSQRPTFRRIWLIPEVFWARHVEVACGQKNIDEKTFVKGLSSFAGLVDGSCLALMGMMPGSRASLQRSEFEFRSLLRRFRAFEAVDSRDKLFALYPLSIDASEALQADYSLAPTDVVRQTIIVLLRLKNIHIQIWDLPSWEVSEFLSKVGYLENAILIHAIKTRRAGLVEILIQSQHVDLDWRGDEGIPPITWAASTGFADAIDILIKYGVPVYSEGGSYGNPLQTASFHGHLNTVAKLLHNGASINAQGGIYGSALQAASHQGHEDVVILLLEAGADINIQGGRYGSALMAAANGKQTHVSKILLDKGAIEFTTIPDDEIAATEVDEASDATSVVSLDSAWSQTSHETGATSVTSMITLEETASTYLVNILAVDEELAHLYRQATTSVTFSKFVRNHARLLKIFFSNIEAEPDVPDQERAIKFLRRRRNRSRVSTDLYTRFSATTEAFQNDMDILRDEERDKLYLLNRLLEEPAMDEPAIQDALPEDDQVSNSSSENDERQDDAQLKNLDAVAKVLTSSSSFSRYKESLREFLGLKNRSALGDAIAMFNAEAIRLQLSKEFENVAKGDYEWLLELQEMGFSVEQMTEMLLDGERDSP